MSNEMSLEKFAMEARQDLEAHLTTMYPGIMVQHQFIEKVNGESYHGLTVRKGGQEIAPVINVEPYYAEMIFNGTYEKAVEELTNKAAEEIENPMVAVPENLMSYETMKADLIMEVIRTEGNEPRLAQLPHRELADMSVIYRFLDQEGVGSIVITNAMMQTYGITESQLFADATVSMTENRPYEIKPLYDTLTAMEPSFAEREEPDNKIFIATNQYAKFGAGVIAHPDFMERVADVMKSSFFILPSSIHEVLLLPDDGSVNYRELMSMVTNINAAMVSPEEKLTDNVYHYDAEDRMFETAKDHAERMQEKEGRFSIMKDLKELKNDITEKAATERPAPSLGGAAL